MTTVNLALQRTPMQEKVTRLIRRRLNVNTLKQDAPTLAGIMVSGWGNYGKTATVCSATAAFEDQWLQLHDFLIPGAIEGTVDLHAPVVYVSTPVTATPKSTCVSILNFFRADFRRRATLPELVRLVADSLPDHGVKVLVHDDISRLRMHRSDDQDVLDLMRAFMSLDVTLILTGVNIPATGLLREAKWDKATAQWVMPQLESTRIHGLEVTQTEHRFELVELDRFRHTTAEQIRAGNDLWFSQKHKAFGGSIQFLSAPDGTPLWVSDVEPGSTPDITAARIHALPALYKAAAQGLPTLADKGYIGAGIGILIPVRRPKGKSEQALHVDTRMFNTLVRHVRALGERTAAELKQRWRTLQYVTLSPSRIGDIARAALVLNG
uniref:transposase family protein n=1 Tax=Streptomyces sp. TRM49041 TaxID=2603216 RepID=UPI0021CCC862